MTFAIPKLREPTLEEKMATSEAWMKPLKPCLYTYWPERFKELSFKTWVEETTKEQVSELTGVFDGKDNPWSVSLQAKIKRGATKFTNGCFFKLESRSPKDNYWGEMTNFRACSFHDVKQLIWSERMLDDLVHYTHLECEPLRLLFREWHPIQKSGEFRCFIRDRRLVGISQYHFSHWDEWRQDNVPLAFRDIVARKAETQELLTRFIETEIIPHLHVENFVVDLWVDHLQKITLIEINPYGLSDPCLLNYPELEEAESLFRIVEA